MVLIDLSFVDGVLMVLFGFWVMIVCLCCYLFALCFL